MHLRPPKFAVSPPGESSGHDIEVLRHCVRKHPYKGYVCAFAKLGTLAFEGPRGDYVLIQTQRTDAGWLDEAWEEARAKLDHLLGSSNSVRPH